MSIEKRLADALTENPDRVLARVLLVALVAAGIAAFAYLLKFGGLPFSDDPQHWGQLGDYIGGFLNPVFGFLSVFALLVTLILQSRELKLSREALQFSQDELKMSQEELLLSREELKLSREEQAKSAEALVEQNRVIQQQRIEQTFFSWLGTYRQILGGVAHTAHEGRPALLFMWEATLSADPDKMLMDLNLMEYQAPLRRCLERYGLKRFEAATPDTFPAISAAARQVWGGLYEAKETQLDSLFRVLYRLFKWIDDQPKNRLTWEDKWLYASIIRSQLSWIEMVFLFYNGMTDRGKNFKTYINRYALFDNLTVERDRLLVILRECPMDSVGYAEGAYSSDAARAAHEAEEAAKKGPSAAP